MISLIIYYLFNLSKLNADKPRYIFLLGMIAAFFGDMFLEFDRFFIFGLSSFLVMQILYTYCFVQDGARIAERSWYGFLLLVLISGVMIFLWDQLGALRIPVLIYSSAIAIMSFSAFIRNSSIKSYSWVFFGTIMFIISDTVIAIHKFNSGLDLGKLTVMVTYILAQYSIVTGYIEGTTIRQQ